ncbi:MAG: class I adenylate-forming enzyme family protein [Candidatus Jordarchaeum sp.]|uniref:class I adenylate-forming enzyme family protein n=1 Tax=Candidatus Jordarchaeum sp. TaxID=2823881 RepID=UPI00404B3D70
MKIYKGGHLYYPEIPFFGILDDTVGRFPDRYAFLHPKKITYKEFGESVDRIATALADIGVRKGDRVIIYSPNCIEWEIACYGISKAGGIFVPMNPMFREFEVEYEIKDAEAETIIIHEGMYPIVKGVKDKTGLKNIIVIGQKQPDTYSFSELLEKYEPKPPRYEYDVKEDLATLLYTSGTTGLPKGSMLTHYNMVANTIQWSSHTDFNETDVFIILIPLYHIFGLALSMNLTIWNGGAQVVMSGFNLAEWCELVEKYQVTYSLCVPPLLNLIVRHLENPEVEGYDWTSFHVMANGAAPVPTELAIKFEKLAKEKCKGTEDLLVGQGWGLSEAAPVAANPFHRNRLETQGILMADTDHKIVDVLTDEELPEPGQMGEIVIRGPQVFKGYWKKPEATEQSFWTDPKTGLKWFRTGDVAFIDEEGYEHLVDRMKEMIKYKGYAVAPAELEDLLFKHPKVLDCAVIPKPAPDQALGEIPKAFIVPKPEYKGKITEQEIIDWVAERIAAYKKIREVEFIEGIPRVITGKILRRDLIKREREKMGLK